MDYKFCNQYHISSQQVGTRDNLNVREGKLSRSQLTWSHEYRDSSVKEQGATENNYHQRVGQYNERKFHSEMQGLRV